MARWRSDPDRSTGIVRSAYAHVAPRTPLWLRGDELVEADGPLLR